jgi:hypothetical protein
MHTVLDKIPYRDIVNSFTLLTPEKIFYIIQMQKRISHRILHRRWKTSHLEARLAYWLSLETADRKSAVLFFINKAK